MAQLTFNFPGGEVAPIVMDGCKPTAYAGEFEIPSDGDRDEIVRSMVQASAGKLHTAFMEVEDMFVMFDTATNEFSFWCGDGRNRGIGYTVDSADPNLPYVERVTVKA